MSASTTLSSLVDHAQTVLATQSSTTEAAGLHAHSVLSFEDLDVSKSDAPQILNGMEATVIARLDSTHGIRVASSALATLNSTQPRDVSASQTSTLSMESARDAAKIPSSTVQIANVLTTST